jgi:hypothetical protein
MEMKKVLPALLLVVTLGFAVPKPPESPKADAAFKKIRALVGEWEGKDDKGRPGKTIFRLVASDTAVMETLTPPGLEEMVSIYSVDKDSIAMIHYCPTHNQPHMKATPESADIKELTFDFLSVDNLAGPDAGHQHKLVLQFDDADHITEFWTWRQSGKDFPITIHFARKKS